jgi:hypothetical protein
VYEDKAADADAAEDSEQDDVDDNKEKEASHLLSPLWMS